MHITQHGVYLEYFPVEEAFHKHFPASSKNPVTEEAIPETSFFCPGEPGCPSANLVY